MNFKELNLTGHLIDVPVSQLIRRFEIKTKNKVRSVNDPVPKLKILLKEWNSVITAYYVDLLKENNIENIPHAYLPKKSIKTNAIKHTGSEIIQFDFRKFYDCCKFEYFKDALCELDSNLNQKNEYQLKRLLIDPNTDGVTQGLPVSGALAGIALIPFWIELKKKMPNSIKFTQYSDDLTFSYTGLKPKEFTVPILSQLIYEALKHAKLDFKLHNDKTRLETTQRKVTGVSINHKNQLTPSRKDYRFLRQALNTLSKSENLEKELRIWNFKSDKAFIGKVSYMRSIDETGKINRLLLKYKETCEKHGLFSTWLEQEEKKVYSPFE